DLPTPDAPTTDATSPGRSSKLRPRRTGITVPPRTNSFLRSRTTTCAPPRAVWPDDAEAAARGGIVGDVDLGAMKDVGVPRGVSDAMALRPARMRASCLRNYSYRSPSTGRIREARNAG